VTQELYRDEFLQQFTHKSRETKSKNQDEL
jgi:hypothetical protein